MPTLHLRNVPLAVREVSGRADNAALLGDLPDRGVDPEAILADLQAFRPDR